MAAKNILHREYLRPSELYQLWHSHDGWVDGFIHVDLVHVAPGETLFWPNQDRVFPAPVVVRGVRLDDPVSTLLLWQLQQLFGHELRVLHLAQGPPKDESLFSFWRQTLQFPKLEKLYLDADGLENSLPELDRVAPRPRKALWSPQASPNNWRSPSL